MRSRFLSLILCVPALLCILTGCDRAETTTDPPAKETSAAKPIPTKAAENELTDEQKSALIGQMIHRASRAQAQGLAGGGVVVHGAWTYKGYTTLSAIENPPFPVRFVAVDLTVKGHNASFDFDDIEIVDGGDLTSYGSDAHITWLTADGKELPVDELPPSAPNPTRALLIFGFPVQSPTFTLYYWGQKLVEPTEIAESGWSLRYPAGN